MNLDSFDSFDQLDNVLGVRYGRKVANNTTLERRGTDAIAVRLHHTDVLTFHRDGQVIANTGGWETVTTKERLNRNGLGVRVFSVKRRWMVANVGRWDEAVDFDNGMDLAAFAASFDRQKVAAA